MAKPKRQIELPSADEHSTPAEKPIFLKGRRLELIRVDGSENENFSVRTGTVEVEKEAYAEYDKRVKREEFLRHLKLKTQLFRRKEQQLHQRLEDHRNAGAKEAIEIKIDKGKRLFRIAGRLTFGFAMVYMGLRGLARLLRLAAQPPAQGVNWLSGIPALLVVVGAYFMFQYVRRLEKNQKEMKEFREGQERYYLQQHPLYIELMRYLAEGLVVASASAFLFPYLPIIGAFTPLLNPFTYLITALYITISYVIFRKLYTEAAK